MIVSAESAKPDEDLTPDRAAYYLEPPISKHSLQSARARCRMLTW